MCKDVLCRRFLTTGQLMQELGVSRTSLLKWRNAGMPYVSLGTRSVRYNLTDVLEWLSNRKVAPRANSEGKEV